MTQWPQTLCDIFVQLVMEMLFEEMRRHLFMDLEELKNDPVQKDGGKLLAAPLGGLNIRVSVGRSERNSRYCL